MKRSRQLEKENKFEQFKRQQKLHPEFAGIYADAFLATPQEVHFFRELLVFDNALTAHRASPDLQAARDSDGVRCLYRISTKGWPCAALSPSLATGGSARV